MKLSKQIIRQKMKLSKEIICQKNEIFQRNNYLRTCEVIVD